jgi:hypothetical protein
LPATCGRRSPTSSASTCSAEPRGGQIDAEDLLGDRVRVKVDGTPPITAEVAPRAVDDLNLDSGGQLWVSVAAEAINVYS